MKIITSTNPPVTTMAVSATQQVPPGYALSIYSQNGEPYGYCVGNARPVGMGKIIKISDAQLIAKYVQSGCSLFTDGGALFAYCG
jgi:hypothetical protein